MVRSSEKRNQMIIAELTHFARLLAGNQGDIEQAIAHLPMQNPYRKTLATAAAEIRAAVAMNERIIAVLGGENRELEKERKELLRDANRYGKELSRIAEE